MNILLLSELLVSVVAFAIGWSVLLRDRRQRAFVNFATLCFTLCIHGLIRFLAGSINWQILWWLSSAVSIGIPVAALRFFGTFLSDDPTRSTRLLRVFWPTTVAMLGAHGYLLFAGAGKGLAAHRFLAKPVFAYVFAGLCLCCYLIERKRRRTSSPLERLRLWYLLVGGAVTVGVQALSQIPELRTVGLVVTLADLLAVSYLYFLSQTLFRFRLLDLNELLGRMVVLSLMVLLLAGLYFLLTVWVEDKQYGVLFFNTIVASFVVLTLIDPVRTRVEQIMSRVVFREKYEFERGIVDLRRELANVIGAPELVRRTLSFFEGSRRATHGAVYLLDREGAGYDLMGSFGPEPAQRVEAATRRPLLDRLRKDGSVAIELLGREHQHGELEDSQFEALRDALEELHASLVVPMLGPDAIIGLFCLRDERLKDAYASREIELFRSLAAQMAITIMNSAVYDRIKERERLAALGEMAAGLAHEIRNPLGAIKGAAQILKGEADPATAEEFRGIIVDEVNRLNGVVSQFLDYARPYRGDPEPMDVNEAVRKAAQIISQQATALEETGVLVEISTDLEENLPPVRADANQLHQVFLNLGLNAVEAMPQGGKLVVRTGLRRVTRKGVPVYSVEVRFRDSGGGIQPQDLSKLFIPFHTTKQKGTGLGLPISQRIIENHGGQIEVRSQPGKGSTFTVVLPVEADAQVVDTRKSAAFRRPA